MASSIEIEKMFPVYKVESDSIISMFGDITFGYELTLPEIFTLSISEYESFHQAWIKAIKVLPKHSIFHKQDWYLEDQYKADFISNYKSSNALSGFLSGASERFFNERPFLKHRCYLFLSKKPEGRRTANSAFSNLFRRSIVPPQILKESFIGDFKDKANQFARILIDSGFIKMTRLAADELAGTTGKPGILERYCYLLNDSEQATIRDISLKDEIKIGTQSCQLFSLSEVETLPSLCGSRINFDKYSTDKTKCSIGFASPLGGLLNCNHIFNQYIFIDDATQTLKQLEAKRLRLQSLSAYSRENAIGRDATHDFLNEAISQQRLPIKAHFNILAWTDKSEQKNELKTLVSAAMAQIDATPKQETDGAPQIWWAGLPGNEAEFPVNDTFDTFAEQACCFLNLETSYKSSLSPFGVRLGDRLSGKPLHVDISDEPMRLGICTNRNKIILGPTGSGKSFFTNHMVRSYYEQGTHILLVDVGHSYKGLCEMVGGYYFTFDEANPIRFNPFYISKGASLDTEKKESLKSLILALWKKEDEVLERPEYVALSNALQGYYAKIASDNSLFPCFNTFYEYLKTEFTLELKADNVKEKHFDLDNLLYVLKPFYQDGEFGYLLNATENLELLSERFIVFELDNIKDHPILFPVVTLIIMETFISKMRRLKGIRKMILIEEAWKAIAKEGMAEYIKYLFKTVRKHFGEAVVVTQEVEDIISSEVIKETIINNSDCKILLDQSKYQNKFDTIQNLLGLTDKEKVQILSINKANDPKRKYKEVFISLGGQLSKVYRTEVSSEEYLAYTTEESEKLKVQQYTLKYGSIQKGIAALASELTTK
ncbi:TraG family conjugative transposon ATPase [Paradesertivirga mongoliensis]|uniref:TraG family conjugative transposon ATPase n=1 Tax=Paradesertivirga mongoliensis TaxID=2100740 RepID=A0ABW4ZQV2_9SPHI|nr:TraG family conjugative transposon ATPase [Pedobacter mongoliensis]